MLPVIAKVNLSVHGCYAYYATAANLDKLYQPVKILAAQISINVCNTYTHPLQGMYMCSYGLLVHW